MCQNKPVNDKSINLQLIHNFWFIIIQQYIKFYEHAIFYSIPFSVDDNEQKYKTQNDSSCNNSNPDWKCDATHINSIQVLYKIS